MTWTCQTCGKTFTSEQAMLMHSCNAWDKKISCPICHGSGTQTQVLGPNIKCPNCNGTGQIRI